MNIAHFLFNIVGPSLPVNGQHVRVFNILRMYAFYYASVHSNIPFMQEIKGTLEKNQQEETIRSGGQAKVLFMTQRRAVFSNITPRYHTLTYQAVKHFIFR